MNDRSGPIPLNRPQMDMMDHVDALLRRHPRLVAAWEAGWSFRLACDDDAIWATLARGGEGDVGQARLQTPRWWLPSRSGRALALAEGLATDLQKEIDARG